MRPRVDAAITSDCRAIARIYNEGIDDRTATFETRHRSAHEVAAWLASGYPLVVVREGPEVQAFASCCEYRPRACYRDIAEFSVYVARSRRGRGLGGLALDGLMQVAPTAGVRKLVSRVFTENVASRRLLASRGFREVGIYRRHGRLDGVWHDVVIVERLLDELAA
ncbi:MAG: arsinothricin resistance N-acetyltransferase ArsN1 [Deinococcales bacterium]